jgi:hypothetical protein
MLGVVSPPAISWPLSDRLMSGGVEVMVMTISFVADFVPGQKSATKGIKTAWVKRLRNSRI